MARGLGADSTTTYSTTRLLGTTAINNTRYVKLCGYSVVSANGGTSLAIVSLRQPGVRPVGGVVGGVICDNSGRGIGLAVVGNGVLCRGNRFVNASVRGVCCRIRGVASELGDVLWLAK